MDIVVQHKGHKTGWLALTEDEYGNVDIVVDDDCVEICVGFAGDLLYVGCRPP
jgi:hypothetical protein